MNYAHFPPLQVKSSEQSPSPLHFAPAQWPTQLQPPPGAAVSVAFALVTSVLATLLATAELTGTGTLSFPPPPILATSRSPSAEILSSNSSALPAVHFAPPFPGTAS